LSHLTLAFTQIIANFYKFISFHFTTLR
jgi:hypothetical protein